MLASHGKSLFPFQLRSFGVGLCYALLTNHVEDNVHRTLTGSPVVDAKYYDFQTRTLKHLQPGDSLSTGPPTVSVHWHNMGMPTHRHGSDIFPGFSASYLQGDIASYIVKLGKFFDRSFESTREGGGSWECKLRSLNVTTYEVVVVAETVASWDDVTARLVACGLGLGHRGNLLGNTDGVKQHLHVANEAESEQSIV